MDVSRAEVQVVVVAMCRVAMMVMFMAVILITMIGMLLYGLVLALEKLLVVKDARVS